jgi:plastocyanin
MLLSTLRSGRRLAAAALVVTMTVAACSSGSTPAPSTAASAASSASPAASAAASVAAGTAVTIQGFAFSPATLTVAVGTTVTWTNQDSAGHTVTADDGSWGSGNIARGETFSQTLSKAGTYAYHCAIHPNMKGTIIVQ